MIELDDPRWEGLTGGYRVPYDPRPVLRALEADASREELWEELWNELHHQGDVGEASYAAMAVLIGIEARRRRLGWNLFALAATIEVERHRKGNPSIPPWLEVGYRRAWEALAVCALEDLRTLKEPERVGTALSVVALARGQTKLGAFLTFLDEDELDELVEDRLAWSELYRESGG